MLHISTGSAGSIIMDAAALCFLAGILVYTSLYRKRGRPDDMLYFAMVMTNMIMAAADGINYSLVGSTVPYANYLIIAGDTIFSIAFEVFPFLLVLYLDYIVNRSEERLRQKRWVLFLPCLLSSLMILANLFLGFLFAAEKGTNTYVYGPYYNLIFIGALIYALFAVVLLRRIDRHLVSMFIILILIRIIWAVWYREISSTAFLFALILAYMHIYAMNRSIYEENV